MWQLKVQLESQDYESWKRFAISHEKLLALNAGFQAINSKVLHRFPHFSQLLVR